MMSSCCSNSKKICPISFGLALGLTAALGYLIWALWVTYAGPTEFMVMYHVDMPTMQEALMRTLKFFCKGLVFGFFIALFYDFISCCCKSKWCCKKTDGACCCGNKKDMNMMNK